MPNTPREEEFPQPHGKLIEEAEMVIYKYQNDYGVLLTDYSKFLSMVSYTIVKERAATEERVRTEMATELDIAVMETEQRIIKEFNSQIEEWFTLAPKYRTKDNLLKALSEMKSQGKERNE